MTMTEWQGSAKGDTTKTSHSYKWYLIGENKLWFTWRDDEKGTTVGGLWTITFPAAQQLLAETGLADGPRGLGNCKPSWPASYKRVAP